jgi:UPF0716 protein FxsA
MFGLFLIFVAIPLMELALLIKVGQSIGFWPTIAIIVVTAALGVAVMQAHGLKAMQRAQAALAEGKTPVQSVVDGTFVMFAGLLLISPGLMTDVLGLLLLIPPVRRVVGNWSVGKLLASGKVHTWTAQASGDQARTTETHERFEPRSGARPEPDGGAAAEPSAKRWTTRGPDSGARSGSRSGPKSAPVIDGEFERIDEKPVDPGKGKDGR